MHKNGYTPKGAFFPLFLFYIITEVSKFHLWNNENVAILNMSACFPYQRGHCKAKIRISKEKRSLM